jgi:predicted phage terminase large subunit-like protein
MKKPADKEPTYSLEEIGAELERRGRACKELVPFIEYTKPNYEAAKHHYYIAGYLEAVERGEIKRLIINMPPRHGKSEMVTRRFPAWYLGRHPERFVISASYNADFATDFGREVRGIVSSHEYQMLFPGTELRSDSRAADRWNTGKNGAYFAAGVGSGITGKGMHLGIIDDPIKDSEEANSPAHLAKVARWYRTAFKTRMMPGAAIIICMTRWAKGDLAGWVMENDGDQWVVVNLPALAEEDDPLGREIDEPLWPEWYGIEALQDLYGSSEPREWAALYQGKPVAEGGNIFKSYWWRYYREMPEFETIIQSWDTAYEPGESNSYSVCTTWGIAVDGYYLISMFRERLETADLNKKVEELGNKFRPAVIVVEKRASGISIIQNLQRMTRFIIEPINVVRDKESRAKGITALCSGGRIFIPDMAPWADTWKAELEEFPAGRHDDIVDSTVHALTYMRDNFMFTSAGSSVSNPVEMDWNVYDHRRVDNIERDWNVYGRRRLHG